MLQLVVSVVCLGLPVAALSWFLHLRLFGSGAVDPRAEGAELRKSRRRHEKARRRSVEQRIFRFGGGFYGVAAIWTLVVRQFQSLAAFTFAIPELPDLFALGPGAVLSALIQHQVQNFLDAILWFQSWGEDLVLEHFLIALIAHTAGVGAARRGLGAELLVAALDGLQRWIAARRTSGSRL